MTTHMDMDNPLDLFEGLEDQDKAAILKSGHTVHCRPGQPLFNQGDPAKRCFMVIRGRLKLSKLHEQGKEAIIRYIGPDETTAALAVFKGRRYPVTARAVGDTRVVAWDKGTMDHLIANHPALARNLLRMTLERLEDIQTRYLELRTEMVEQRIARALLRIMQHAGRRSDDGILIDLPLSRQDLADYSGTTLYTVSRTLSAWEKRGWVRSGRERIVVADPHALVLFSEKG